MLEAWAHQQIAGVGGAIVLPASADGLIGGGLVKNHYSVSPDGTMYAEGVCKSNGQQVVRIHDLETGELVEAEHVVRNVDIAGDDHNLVAVCWYPDGSLIACACGHNTTNDLATSRRSAAGVWTDEAAKTFSATLTYPSVWLENDGKARVWVRVGSNNWEYATRATISTAWGVPVRYMAEGAQCYSYQRYDPNQNAYLGWMGVLDTNPEHGKLKAWRMDAATGAFSQNGGSALVLPFATTDIVDLFTPPAGYKYTATQFNLFGNAATINKINEADLDDTQVLLLTWDTDHTDPADCTLNTTAILNFGARLAYGTNNNLPSIAWEEAPHSGYAFYTSYKTTVANAIVGTGTQALWVLSKFTSSDGVNWTETPLLKHARRGNSAGPVTCRPVCAFGANSRTPLMVQRFSSYTDFNVFTDARVEFCAPVRGRNCFNLEAETEAWIALLSVPPTDLLTAQVNALLRDFNDEGLTSRIGFLPIAPVDTWEQRKTSLLGGYAGTPRDASGNVIADPTITPRSWFNASVDGYCIDFDMIPGVAGNHKMTQNSNCFGILSCGDSQNAAFTCGTTQFTVNPRNASDQFVHKNSIVNSDNTATGQQGPARGTYMTRRAASSSAYGRYKGNGSTVENVTRTSAVLDAAQRWFWGAPNNGSNLPGTIANRPMAANFAGLHLTNNTDNVKLDSALGANLNLMYAEVA